MLTRLACGPGFAQMGAVQDKLKCGSGNSFRKADRRYREIGGVRQLDKGKETCSIGEGFWREEQSGQ